MYGQLIASLIAPSKCRHTHLGRLRKERERAKTTTAEREMKRLDGAETNTAAEEKKCGEMKSGKSKGTERKGKEENWPTFPLFSLLAVLSCLGKANTVVTIVSFSPFPLVF